MEILNQFGFDIKLFAAQIVNFLVIAYVFKRFLYKPILTVLAKRNEAIKKSLKDAENAAKELEKAEEKSNEILKKAGKEAERMIEEAKEQAGREREELLEKTKSDIQRMTDDAMQQIALERENFRKEAESLSLELSKNILEKTVSALFDKNQKDTIVKKGINLIENVNKAKN